MRNELYLKDIRRTESIENFVNEKVHQLTDKLIQPDSDLHVDVRITKDRKRTAARKPSYQCEVLVKSGMSAKIYKAIRHDESMYRAIVASFQALKHLLGDAHDRIRHERRRHGAKAQEISDLTGPEVSGLATYSRP
jgi:ribosome-associated translation inhibitor RaiA